MAALLLVCMVILMSDSGMGQSLSRQKTVTMSSLNKEWVGSLAVDGNYNRDASRCNCCAGTSSERNLVDQWMEIDLGEATEFNRIVVYGHTSGTWPRQNLRGLSIHLDGSKTNIASIDNTGQGFVNFHNFDLGRTYKATLIKLILKGSDKVLVLCEVDVFSDSIISKRKYVTAISTYSNWTTSNAVDGNMGTNADVCLCCAATSHHPNPWMKVDLGDEFLITYIQMFGRTDNPTIDQSLGGMIISVEGVAIKTVPASATFISYYEVIPTPAKNGRNVKFVLTGDRRLITMCEVVIYGVLVCKAGTYGPKCSESCGNCTVGDTCNAVNGHCTKCEDGYDETDKTCKTQCVDGRYGYNCSETCGKCRNSEICNFKTGQCQECEDGYMYSDRLCMTVYIYGRNCQNTCGSCKGDEICNTVNGHCTECEDGYKESDKTCKSPCEDGHYGRNCSESCGNCKDNNTCNAENGECTECEYGYIETDRTCKTRCPEGRYGHNCSETCGNCRNSEICNFKTGQCQECEDGYTFADLVCKTVCDNGTYGTNCGKTCGNCRGDEICNTANGNCSECEDGYRESDKTCKTQCPSEYYGRNCAMPCGSCKNEPTCSYVDGRCGDCANGTYVYDDKLCNEECEPHTYGYNCTSYCGKCRNGVPCDRVNGHCVECENGYTSTDGRCNTVCGWGTYGNNCTNNCGYCFDNETCDSVNGSCFKCAQGYLGIMCADRLEQSADGDSESNTPVIVGVIVPVVLIIAIATAVAVVIIKRRRPTKQSRKNGVTIPESLYQNTVVVNKPSAGKEQIEEEPVTVTVENHGDIGDITYYDFINTVHGIPIHRLWDHIAMNKGDGFLKEYGTLKEGLIHPHNDALANRERIRYREMFPYDHSRVHLKVERSGESEFINASHIDGFEKEAKFIASQGPIDVMVDDFWRMIWQHNTTKLVMLTNLVETGTSKCIQYWPQEDTVDFGHINITMVHEQTESDYSIRTLDIAQDNEPPRRVKQYHYKAWPDKDVPDSTWSLTQFWREVFRDEDKSPIVVHCSAGVGRTGTFIAMDNLYHQAITTGSVTPLKVVERLRDQRVKMVQTSEQYEFLHEAVADTLLFGTHYLWQSQYPGYYDFMMKKDTAIGGKIRLKHQFELLKKNIDEKPVLEQEGDAYKPTASIGARQDTGEQTPISLTSLGGSDSFLLTTIPTTKTLTGMFRMIDEHNVRTVITLVDSTRPGSSILGSINKLTCGKYQPIQVSSKTVNSVTEKIFKYTKHVMTQGNDCDGRVKQLELSLLTSAESTSQAESVSQVFDVISKWHPYVSTKEPVMIQCRDGVTQCGIMAVLLNEKLRLLKNGGQIHILDSVMKVKCGNRSCISTYKQYKFIHDILLHVLKEKDRVNPDPGDAGDLGDENIYQNM